MATDNLDFSLCVPVGRQVQFGNSWEPLAAWPGCGGCSPGMESGVHSVSARHRLTSRQCHPSGVISGKPERSGTFDVAIAVSDQFGKRQTASYRLVVED